MIFASGLFLIIGLLVHAFKKYSLISGYNMMSESEKENIDIVSVSKIMGYSMYFLAVVFFLTSFLAKKYPNVEMIAVVVLFITIVLMIAKLQKYDKREDKSESKVKWFIIAIPMIIIAITLSVVTANTKIEVGDSGINIATANIEYSEITEVNLIDEVPTSRKIIGGGIGTKRKGTYDVEGYGRCQLYTDIKYGTTVVLKTKEKIFIFNLKNEEETKTIYESLIKKIGEKN